MGFVSRPQKRFTKTITFDGTAGNGAVGTVTTATITGRVRLLDCFIYCSVDLTEAGVTATLSHGITGQTTLINGATNAVDLDAGEWWSGTNSVTVGTRSPMGNASLTNSMSLSGNIFLTVGSQNVTGGTLVFDYIYEPLTVDGALA